MQDKDFERQVVRNMNIMARLYMVEEEVYIAMPLWRKFLWWAGLPSGFEKRLSKKIREIIEIERTEY